VLGLIGIDNKPHKDYPFMMIVGDVMDLKPSDLQGYDLNTRLSTLPALY
jgi:hypothetical protein